MAVQPDIDKMRNQYAQQMMQQQGQAMQGVQGIYAGRGTTGSGEEAQAFGDLGMQFGAAAGAQEAGLEQYFGNLGQQQSQFDIGQQNWQQQFGEQQKEFGQQFGLQQAQLTGYMPGTQTPTMQGQEMNWQTQTASDMGFKNPAELLLWSQNPDRYQYLKTNPYISQGKQGPTSNAEQTAIHSLF